MSSMNIEIYKAFKEVGATEETAQDAGKAFEVKEDRLTNIEKDMIKMDGHLTNIEKDVSHMKQDLSSVESRLNRLESNFNLFRGMQSVTIALLVAVIVKLFI